MIKAINAQLLLFLNTYYSYYESLGYVYVYFPRLEDNEERHGN